MKLLLSAMLALLILTGPASAQGTCQTSAQMRRDQCTRENTGDGERSRQCMDNYLAAMDRCTDRGYDPVNPPAPRGRNDPLNPSTPRSDPVTPQVNPRPTPIEPRIQPRVQPVVPYDKRRS